MDDLLDILAFGAHPDDVELMCGGTIIKMAQKGYRVGVISLTAGEMGTRGSATIRAQEFAKAAQIMGVVIHKTLDIPDSDVHVCQEYKHKVIHEIRLYRPKLVIAPYWHTRHPDHANCSHLVRESVFLAGLKKLLPEQQSFRPLRLIYYMEHFEFKPTFIVDVSDTFDLRIKAIKAYRSQVFTGNLKTSQVDATYVSSQQYFQSLYYRAQYWGGKIGVKYGEPFYMREALPVSDPFGLLCADDHH